jgi:peptidoglycan/xylan/chitin deacetylase (PgdA/CDA1 family)
MRLKHQLCAGGFRAIAALRADRWLRRLGQGRGVILMFHRVRPWRGDRFAPNRVLEITPEFLEYAIDEIRRSGYEIIPIDEVPHRLAARPSSRRFAVLTFDDGYRDNVEHAWPVLKRHDAPWTLFVTADFADGEGRLWWLELEQAIARLDRIALHGAGVAERSTGTSDEKQAAFSAIHKLMRSSPEYRLRTIVADLSREAGIDSAQLVRQTCLGWDDLRILASEPGLTIGAHTVSHPILAKQASKTAIREIFGCKTVLERRLGRPIRHFAYPFGDRSAAGAREFQLAWKAGFATAVTSRPGHVFPEHAKCLHALPRVSVNGLFQSRATMRALLSGVPFLAWNGRRIPSVETYAIDDENHLDAEVGRGSSRQIPRLGAEESQHESPDEKCP